MGAGVSAFKRKPWTMNKMIVATTLSSFDANQERATEKVVENNHAPLKKKQSQTGQALLRALHAELIGFETEHINEAEFSLKPSYSRVLRRRLQQTDINMGVSESCRRRRESRKGYIQKGMEK